MEDVLVGFAILVVLGLLAGILMLPVIALLRLRQLHDLRARLERLERQFADRASEAAAPPPRGKFALPAEEPEEPPLLAEVVETAEPAPAAASTSRPGRQPAILLPHADVESLEAWIGRRALGWVAVVLLLFAVAFFLKHAFENRWIGETGRVAIGVLAGVGLALGGFRYHRQGWPRFGQMFTAAGVVLFYLSTFAAFGYYHLIGREAASVFLVALVAEAALLAVLYEAPAIALVALVGALLTPILLRTTHDQYRSLFLYLATVNAGVVGIALLRSWRALGTVALLGTQALFWLWYDKNYHPEKMTAALAFQGAILVLMLAYAAAIHLRHKRNASAEDLVRMLLAGALFFAAGYAMLDADYHVWMGTFALGVAILYAALGYAARRWRPGDERLLLGAVAVSLGFVAAVFPIQADAAWIALGWAVEGLALWWFGLRVRAPALRAMGAALLILAAGRVALVDTPRYTETLAIPFWNEYATPGLIVAAGLLGAAAVARRYVPRLAPLDHAVLWATALGGTGLAWLVLSREAYLYCQANLNDRAAQTALSVVWALYAAVILAVGFRIRSGAARLTALALFAVTLAKVVLVDMAGLAGFYRVGVFLVLALMMAAGARAYQKRQLTSGTDAKGPQS